MFVRKNDELTELEKEILELVKIQEGRPIPVNIIVNKIKIRNKNAIYAAIDYLIKKEALIRITNGKIVLGYINGPIKKDEVYIGTINLTAKGDAFFKKEGDQKASYYINKINVNDAMDGDKVKICPVQKPQTYPDVLDGYILEIVERSKDFFVGTYYTSLEGNKRVTKIVPENQKIKYDIKVDDDSQLVNGTIALFKIVNVIDNKIYCGVSRILGHIDDVGSDIVSLVYDNGVTPEFSAEVESETHDIDFNFSQEEDARRKDLSHLNFVTIDPITSKDMDDAIYVEKAENNFRLFVAIADVSYYVKLHSELWKSSLERGTSIYLVNQVIPMLPHKLSNNICSLNPFEKRYSMVCEMVINHEGKYESIDVYPAIIVSKKKFAYENINDYFVNQTKLEDTDNSIYEMIDVARQLHNYLNKRHYKEGYIDFDIPEAKIILDEQEKIKDVVVKKTGEAQKMIENFMVAANEAVTLKFEQLKPNIPFVYRVHARPEEKKIEAFKVEAKKIGFKFDATLTEWQPNTVSKWLENNLDNPNKELINIILLRTMAKAKYDSINIGHFGLSLKKYTHFTSPIRRLADVVVHHLYRAFVFDTDRYSDADRTYLLNSLDHINDRANTTETLAVSTERDVNAMKFAEYMEDKVGQEFDGYASYITPFGIYVQLPNTIEGMIKPNNLKDDFYAFDEDNLVFVGKNKKKVITLGQKLKIKVVSACKATKKIDFELVKFI